MMLCRRDSRKLMTGNEAALKESTLKCAALEESLQRQLKEKEESHRREVKEREGSVKHVKDKEFQKRLQENKKKLNEDLNEKVEAMRQELLLIGEDFKKQRHETQK